MMRLFGKNSGTNGRTATAHPWTIIHEDFPPISSPSYSPHITRMNREEMEKGKTKNLKYLREFYKEALGLGDLACGRRSVVCRLSDLWQGQVSAGRQVCCPSRCLAETLSKSLPTFALGYILLPKLWGFR